MDETHDDPVTPAANGTASQTQRLSRRWFVAGGVAVVVGGGAGVAFDFARGRPARATPAHPPVALIDALVQERTLLAAARAARRGDHPSTIPGTVVAALIRDHEAHLVALTAALANYSTSGRTAGIEHPGTAAPGDRAALRSLERRAAHDAARRAGQLTGDTAALLASIAACEATHVELLS